MIKIKVKHIPQDDWYKRSFNVLVPLEIQGKEGVLVADAKPPTMHRGSQAAECLIDGKCHLLPIWAYEKIAVVRTQELTYSI